MSPERGKEIGDLSKKKAQELLMGIRVLSGLATSKEEQEAFGFVRARIEIELEAGTFSDVSLLRRIFPSDGNLKIIAAEQDRLQLEQTRAENERKREEEKYLKNETVSSHSHWQAFDPAFKGINNFSVAEVPFKLQVKKTDVSPVNYDADKKLLNFLILPEKREISPDPENNTFMNFGIREQHGNKFKLVLLVWDINKENGKTFALTVQSKYIRCNKEYDLQTGVIGLYNFRTKENRYLRLRFSESNRQIIEVTEMEPVIESPSDK